MNNDIADSELDELCSKCEGKKNLDLPITVNSQECKWLLLQNAYKVDVRHLDVKVQNKDFKPFYKAVLEDLQKVGD